MKPLAPIRGLRLGMAALIVLLGLLAGTERATARPAAQHASSSSCQIINLGTLGGPGEAVLATDVNTRGEIVGFAGGRAFEWKAGKMIDIGTLPGGNSALAAAINERGEIVGGSAAPPFQIDHAFLWRAGTMTDLGDLGGLFSAAADVNEAGQVVGSSDPPSSSQPHAFLWDHGVMRDLGTLGASSSSAAAVNNRGQVVGTSALADFSFAHAFVYDHGVMSDLGLLPGVVNGASSAHDVNDRGQIVGGATSPTAGGWAHPVTWKNSVISDLGVPSGFVQGNALGISNAGDIVGVLDNGFMFSERAFLYRHGAFVDLNALCAAPADGWVLSSATAISSNGLIVGDGFLDGAQRAFLLELHP
jgi:probable HAF family extracellular repeat protein